MIDVVSAEKALIETDAPELCELLHRAFRRRVAKKHIRAMVEFALLDGPVPAAANASEKFFLDSIEETKRRLNGGEPDYSNHVLIGPELDFVADTRGMEGWGPAQCLNYLLLSRIPPRHKAIVVTAMRDDGIYILEWIAYYQALGFDHLAIYTNDNSDGSEVLLRLLASHSVITLIESETGGTVPPEGKAYGHAIHLLPRLRDFEWALFVDSDEYLVPAPRYHNSISTVLTALDRQFPEQPPSGICYDWMWFVSGMVFARTPEILLERFKHARHHHLPKCFARVRDVVSMRLDHCAEVREGGFLVDSAFDPIDMESIFWRTPQYAGGRVNHYWCRSFEEFAVKKARGASLKLEVNSYDRPFENFFAWNEYETEENYQPASPEMLRRVKSRIEKLKALEGVRALADGISTNFPTFLAKVTQGCDLRAIYESSKAAPETF